MNPWTIKKLLAWSESYFAEHGIDSPRLTAEILLAHLLELRRLDLYLQHDRPLEAGELADFKTLIKRRRAREPLAYITGERGFFNDTFQVEKGVLIPRPETELLVEAAVDVLSSAPYADSANSGRQARVVELGVGSGAIIVSVAAACPGHLFFGCDLSPKAIFVAGKNATALCSSPIHFFRSSWLSAVSPDARFDMILSNPPYIPSGDIPGLEPEVREFEPSLALNGGSDGLDAMRIILEQAGDRLIPGGVVLLEMGYDQKTGMETLAGDTPWVDTLTFQKDLSGHDRLVMLKKRN